MSAGSSHLSSLLTDTVRMLCQNTVEYSESLRIQGLLVVTADSNRVHVIEISDMSPSAQSTGVGSSGLCETEAEVNDYKPPIQMAAPDYPAHPAASQPAMGQSYPTKATGARGGFRPVKPPVKRRGNFHGFPSAKRSYQRTVPRKPSVKMDSPIVVDDLPDDVDNMAGDMNMVVPKLESGWADATGNYPNIQEYPPEAIEVPGYHGSDIQLYGNVQSSKPHRGRRRAAVSHTVTSSDGMNEQSALAYDDMAQDMKPYLNYDVEPGSNDGSQSFLSQVCKHFYISSLLFTARCYASAVLAMALCLSVRHKSEFY